MAERTFFGESRKDKVFTVNRSSLTEMNNAIKEYEKRGFELASEVFPKLNGGYIAKFKKSTQK